MPGHSAVEHHAELARDWEGRYSTRRSFRERHRILTGLLEALVRPGAHWLDAGCGSGHFSRQLATLGARVTGVDGAEAMISVARSLGAGGGAEIVYRSWNDLTAIDEPDGAFDGVLCSSVIEYLPQPERALAEFHRVTRAGGALVVSVPNARALVRLAHAAEFAVTKAVLAEPRPAYWAHMKRMWTASEARALARDAGYEPRSIQAGGLGIGPAWLDRQPLWGPLLFVSAVKP